MFRHNIKVIYRNISKHRFYALINILGLSLGITLTFLIGLYVSEELSFDRFHWDAENIYQVGLHVKFAEQEFKTASSCPPLAGEMLKGIPGIEHVTRVHPWPLKNIVIKYQDKAFAETKAMLADSNFFNFFSFRLLEGNPREVLIKPHAVVMTSAAARRYFGNDRAIGKIISVGKDNQAYTVTGIAEVPPANSCFQFDLLLSAVSYPEMQGTDWGDNNGVYTYIRKNRYTRIESIREKLGEIVNLNVSPILEDAFGVTYHNFQKQGSIYSFVPYKLVDSHLHHPEIPDGLTPNSDIKFIFILTTVGLFILLLACINYMNLMTARSIGRAKEVALRKSVGSYRSTLIFQFLSESGVYVITATVIAVVATYLLLPSFNLVSGKAFEFAQIVSPEIIFPALTGMVLVAVAAGSYPAFYLSAFNPVNILRGTFNGRMKSKSVRRVLVMLQFTICIALLISTIVVYRQLSYMHENSMGLDKHNVLLLHNAELLGTQQDAFFHAINGGSTGLTASYINTTFPGVNRVGSYRAAGTTRDFLFPTYSTDYNHLNTLKIQMLEGRFFSEDIASDSLACVVNEAVVKELGWLNPLDEKLMTDDSSHAMSVIGVMKNFNIESFHSKIRPLVIHYREKSNYMLIRYDGNPIEAVARIASLWKEHAANEPFEYLFLDQQFDALFREENRLGKLFSILTGAAIVIASLGLFGLASFTAEQRSKEIGIRKVLGASVTSLNLLLSKDLFILISMSFVIASVFAWYAMDQWLGTFAYRISLGMEVFVIGGLIAATIAWLTVTFHFMKAASRNPVDVLRME